MIGKTPLHFDLGEASEVRISKQEAQALRYKPDTTNRNVSDYESNDEDKELDVWVQHCEIGAWDAKGRFASAWQSKELRGEHQLRPGEVERLLTHSILIFSPLSRQLLLHRLRRRHGQAHHSTGGHPHRLQLLSHLAAHCQRQGPLHRIDCTTNLSR